MPVSRAMHHPSSSAAALAAVASCALALAPSAGARPLKLTVTGKQTTTWKYVKQQAATCDWPETEAGEQTISLNGKKAATIDVKVGQRGKLQFSSTAITVDAKAELRRTFDRRYADQASCPGGGANSGGDQPAVNVQGTKRCSVEGAVKLRLGTTREELYAAGDPARSTPLTSPLNAGSALLRGEPAWKAAGSWPFLPASCSDAGQPDADIAITEGGGEWAGGLVETRAALPIAQLLKQKRGSKTVRVKATVDYPNADQPSPGLEQTTGRTVLDLRLTLAR